MELNEFLNKEDRTLAWLARKLYISRPYLSDMLRGRRPFQDKYLKEILRITQGKVTPVEIVKHVEQAEKERLKKLEDD